MKKIIVLLILIFIIFNVSIFANSYGSAGLALQYMKRDGFNNLNKILEENYVGKIKENSIKTNMFVYVYNDKSNFVWGIDGSVDLSPHINKGDSLSSSLQEIIATLDIGYQIINSSKFKVYPLLGIGMSRFQLGINKSEISNINWDDLVNHEYTSFNVDRKYLIMKSSIRTELSFIKLKKGKSYLLIGMEAGYHYTLLKGKNKLYNTDISLDKIPDYNTDGFFVKVSLGFREY